MPLTFTVQEHLLPGDDIAAKWAVASRLGYGGIELRGGAGMRERLPELSAAAQAGVPMQSICVITRTFIGAFTEEERAEARRIIGELLEVAAAVDAKGVITPAAYGIHSNRLPPHKPRRPPEEDRAILTEALSELGGVAGRLGVELWLEPLNRYEDHMVNTLAQATTLVEAVGQSSVRIMADLFHMNIEETNTAEALRRAGAHVGHVHVADNQRLEPGTGQTDFAAAFAALRDIGFSGVCALECGLSADPETSLAAARAALRDAEG